MDGFELWVIVIIAIMCHYCIASSCDAFCWEGPTLIILHWFLVLTPYVTDFLQLTDVFNRNKKKTVHRTLI